MRKVLKMTSFVVLAGSLLLTGCTPSEVDQQAGQTKPQPPQQQGKNEETPKVEASDLEKVKAYMEEQNQKIKEKEEELNYYKEYVKEVTLTLPEDKMKALVDKEWNYAVTINNVQFPSSGLLEIRETAFDIVFTEKRVQYSVLPEEQSLKGKIKNKLKSSIDAKNDDGVPQLKEDENDTTLTFSYKDLKPGDVIAFHLDEDLMKKLGILSKELQIKIAS